MLQVLDISYYFVRIIFSLVDSLELHDHITRLLVDPCISVGFQVLTQGVLSNKFLALVRIEYVLFRSLTNFRLDVDQPWSDILG